MKRGNGTFWFGAAFMAALCAATYFLLEDDESLRPQSRAILRMDSAVPNQETSVQSRITQSARVQQVIDSGQFAPPPGNPEKMFSIASPFNHALPRTVNQATTAPLQAGEATPTAQPIGAMRLAVQEASAASANGTSPSGPSSPGELAVQARQPAAEFDTPPGIGSAKGGQ